MSEHSSQADDRAVRKGSEQGSEQGSKHSSAQGGIRLRVALAVLAATAVVGIGAGAAATLLGRSSSPSAATGAGAAVESWGAGIRPAPAFALRDQNGRSVSLASLRGKPAIITFLDPLCRNVCPLEAQVLNQAVSRLPADKRPAVIAISVNRWGNARSDLLADVDRWRLAPTWRWAVGDPAALATAWRRYGIGVQVTTTTIAGIKVHEITHTLASFVIDGTGHERALFVWPFGAPELEHALASLKA